MKEQIHVINKFTSILCFIIFQKSCHYMLRDMLLKFRGSNRSFMAQRMHLWLKPFRSIENIILYKINALSYVNFSKTKCPKPQVSWNIWKIFIIFSILSSEFISWRIFWISKVVYRLTLTVAVLALYLWLTMVF